MKAVRPKKSDVWKYYEIDAEDDSRAICNLCQPSKIISRGSKLKGPQSYGTSALWGHLKLSHKQEYSSLEKCPSYPSRIQVANKQQRLISKGKKHLLNVNEEHMHFLSNNSQNNRMDETLIEASPEQEEHLNLIGQMIALDNQPISIVEEEGFKKLLQAFLPTCNVLNSLYFSSHIIPHIYLTTRNKIQALLQEVEYITLGIDIDRNVFQTETLLVITATWFNNECKQSSCILGTNVFTTFPSYKIIDALLQDTLNDWDINKSKVHLVIHPYVKQNMNSVQVVQGVTNETYFQHLVQLLIEDTLLSQSRVNRVLDLCRNVICYSTETRETIDLLNLLHNVQPLKRPDSELVLDCSSNWQSTYKMLLNTRGNMEEINNISTLNQALSISTEDWSIISQTIDVFEPINEIMNSTTTETNLISNVIPYLATILRYFETNPSTLDSEIIQTVKNAINNKINDDYPIEDKECLVLATVLDPRYKLSFVSDRCKKNSKNWLLERIQPNQQPDFNPYLVKQEPAEKKGIWSCFNEMTEENCETTNTKTLLQREIDEYLSTKLLNREFNPLDWWKANKTFFPNLFAIAKRFLSPPMDCSFLRKNDNLLTRLRRSVDEDALANSLLDINQRLFLHFNLSLNLEN